MTLITSLVFVLTYLGMALGRLPGLRVDRAWIAIAAAMILVLSGAAPATAVAGWIDWPALLLLLAMMIVSAQCEFSGVYARLSGAVDRLSAHPLALLAAVIGFAGGLSALLVNDIVAFALAPLLIHALRGRGLDPQPYLLALACACNAGSAASLVGNPQNILIGQIGSLDFWSYLHFAIVPAGLALATVFLAIAILWRGQWRPGAPAPTPVWRTAPPARKAWLALIALLLLFATPLPRELSALTVAVLLMASRQRRSGDYLRAVDWNLLLLFVGLFIVTGALGALPTVQTQAAALAAEGRLPASALSLAGASLLGSNLIGNVPFVLLLLSIWPELPVETLRGLALLSTLAGNLLLVGSVVNLIVAEQAARLGVPLGFARFARVGLPVTLLSMATAVLWLWRTGGLPLY